MKKLNEKQVQELLSDFSLDSAEQIIDGKSKTLYLTEEKDLCLMGFKPSLRSITFERKQNIAGTDKERIKSCIEIYLYLEKHGIRTQLVSENFAKLAT